MKLDSNSIQIPLILVMILGLVNILSAQVIDEQKMKLNIKKLSNPLEKLQYLEPVTFNYNTKDFKELNLPNGNHSGFLIAEVEKVLPDLIQVKNKVYQQGKNNSKVLRVPTLKQEDLTSLLVAAIKEQQLQIDELKRELKEIKDR